MAKPITHRRREPAPGVFRLLLPLPFPGLDRVNCYLLAGDEGAVLVDCGIYFPDPADDHGWDHVVAALAAAGHEPGDVRTLLVTHPHIDHYGMAARLKQASGCEIVMHADSARDIAGYKDPASTARRLRALFRAHGVDHDELDELTRFEDWRGFIAEVVEADRTVSDGDVVRAGERAWKVMHTPGHARSHICLFDEHDSILISGDHILPAITPHIDFRSGDDDDPLGDFLASLQRVEKADPRLVLPGHGHPFEGGAERARVIERHHDRRLGAILQVIRRNPCTAEQITLEIFGTDLLNFAHRLALGEALAHLVYLEGRGEVELVDEGGTFLYRKAKRARVEEDDD